LAIRDDIVAHYAAGTLPELFVRSIRMQPHEEVAAALRAELIALHNDGTIDVLEPAQNIAELEIGQHDFFFVQHIYVDIIPQLEAEVSTMLAAVKALVARAGNDLASGMPNGALRTWAETGTRAIETMAALNIENGEDAAALFLALQALAKTDPADALDRAIAYLTGLAPPARLAAAKAIGAFDLPDASSQDRGMAALAAAMSTTTDDNLRGNLISAAAEMAMKASAVESRAVELIHAANEHVGDNAIHHSSSSLSFHAKDLAAPIVSALAVIAHKVKPDSKGTLDQLDHAGWALVNSGRCDEALALIAPILSANHKLVTLEAFDSFSHALLALPSDQIASIVVKWLLSFDFQLGEAARGLVGSYHGDSPLNLEFNAKALGISPADQVLLAHRVIGYLFVHPVTAASRVFSLIRIAEPESREAMAEILFDPLLINFSGSLSDWLTTKAADDSDPAKPVIDTLLVRLEAYLDGLRRAGRIKELRPSERERLIENHRQHESMREAYANAEKRSVFMSLVSRSVLLYGARSISYYNPNGGTPERHEMKLHSFSHSIESPRLDVLEPFDLDYTLRVFRSMRAAE
jgi:hypothetical protein